MRWTLLGLAGVLVAFMVLSGVLGIVNIGSSATKGDDLYRNATVPIERLESVETGLGNVDTEQSSASTQEVSASTEATSASAQEISASAQELAGNAEVLNQLVAQFKTNTV